MLLMTANNAKKIYTKFTKCKQVQKLRKDISTHAIMAKNGDKRKVWNYVLPKQHKSTRYSPIKSIPPLTKQTTQ